MATIKDLDCDDDDDEEGQRFRFRLRSQKAHTGYPLIADQILRSVVNLLTTAFRHESFKCIF